ncbi:MAG: hypothetical protein ABIU58_03380 [Ramlibacter sp.]
MLPKTIALVSTVLLLMSLGFFVLGSTPLLILKHNVPMDSRVIRLHDGDTAAISRFRRLHMTGIALNAVQLVAVGSATSRITL